MLGFTRVDSTQRSVAIGWWMERTMALLIPTRPGIFMTDRLDQ
jgi:hypothetical protein